MKKIAFVLACILTISICLAGCQETEFDTGEGTPVFSLDANEISAVTVKAKLFCPEIAGLFCRIAGLFCHDSRANLSLKPVCFGIAIS